MESQPQNPENFHPCEESIVVAALAILISHFPIILKGRSVAVWNNRKTT